MEFPPKGLKVERWSIWNSLIVISQSRLIKQNLGWTKVKQDLEYFCLGLSVNGLQGAHEYAMVLELFLDDACWSVTAAW